MSSSQSTQNQKIYSLLQNAHAIIKYSLELLDFYSTNDHCDLTNSIAYLNGEYDSIQNTFTYLNQNQPPFQKTNTINDVMTNYDLLMNKLNTLFIDFLNKMTPHVNQFCENLNTLTQQVSEGRSDSNNTINKVIDLVKREIELLGYCSWFRSIPYDIMTIVNNITSYPPKQEYSDGETIKFFEWFNSLVDIGNQINQLTYQPLTIRINDIELSFFELNKEYVNHINQIQHQRIQPQVTQPQVTQLPSLNFQNTQSQVNQQLKKLPETPKTTVRAQQTSRPQEESFKKETPHQKTTPPKEAQAHLKDLTPTRTNVGGDREKKQQEMPQQISQQKVTTQETNRSFEQTKDVCEKLIRDARDKSLKDEEEFTKFKKLNEKTLNYHFNCDEFLRNLYDGDDSEVNERVENETEKVLVKDFEQEKKEVDKIVQEFKQKIEECFEKAKTRG
ncbi:hypothetical protein QTN25_004254 [Entamoeba marina]